MDYSWHVQHLLREFGRGQFADSRSVAGRQADGETPQQYEPHLANRVRSDLLESQARVWQGTSYAFIGGWRVLRPEPHVE